MNYDYDATNYFKEACLTMNEDEHYHLLIKACGIVNKCIKNENEFKFIEN